MTIDPRRYYTLKQQVDVCYIYSQAGYQENIFDQENIILILTIYIVVAPTNVRFMRRKEKREVHFHRHSGPVHLSLLPGWEILSATVKHVI